MNTTPVHLNKRAIRIIRVPIRKHHIKIFCAGSGAVLMIIDATTAAITALLHLHIAAVIETLIATLGKSGAAVAGLTFIFEKAVSDERDIHTQQEEETA